MSASPCPGCGNSQSDVMESRESPLGLRRRRQCRSCAHRWSTVEVALVEVQGSVDIRQLVTDATLALVSADEQVARAAEKLRRVTTLMNLIRDTRLEATRKTEETRDER